MEDEGPRKRIDQNPESDTRERVIIRDAEENPRTRDGPTSSEKSGETETPQRTEYEHSKLNEQIYRYTFIPRIILAGCWPVCMAICSYNLYLAQEAEPDLKELHIFSPGMFTNLTGRGRDFLDNLWNLLAFDFFPKCYLWYGFYGVFARLLQSCAPKTLPTFSMLLSFAFLIQLVSFPALVFALSQMVVFWIIQRLNSKIALWLTALSYLFGTANSFHQYILPLNEEVYGYYYLIPITSWNCGRCISFYYDTWNRPNRTSLTSLLTCTQFCFYFPLTVWGPLECFERYEKSILLPSASAKPKCQVQKDFFYMIVKLVRFSFWGIFSELLLHYLYFSMISKDRIFLEPVNMLAIFGIMLWLGHFIQLKYIVLYGIPGAIAEADGLPMLVSPSCIIHIHRYSNLWRAIDRGMYNWFVRYCYVPTLELIAKLDKENKIQKDFRNILAALPPFVFIILWHHYTSTILVWALTNFVLLTAEKVASYIKRRIDSKYNIAPAIWDVIVEPIFTTPLGPISGIINSALFGSNLVGGHILIYRSFTEGIYYLPYGYFMGHLGVLVATWPKVCKIVFRKPKGRMTR
ncbi:unnamed protein product [Allacma fusca]|uniref:Uncharacterized protein n=1 Tax=Allacma fusca TaxID=39272 RepID=A0A8J2PU41_9HEXA|nr:unnamed protein product [Allacma fusca]